MKKLLFNPLSLAVVFTILLSCSEKQDFNQFDDLSITPTLTSSILYLESDEQFINTLSAFDAFYSQTVNFDAFNEQYVAERLLEGKIIYEFENTTSKRLNIAIDFLDEGGGVLDTESFDVEPATTPAQTTEITYGPSGKSLDILRATSGLRITGTNLSDATSVSTASEPKIIMRSAAEFLFRLK
ncbi:hypothetical protein [Flagellimonas sp.]|uniref:hypothetical protein n=1 Tax=Flagellimonas sp. TaxID=2058762 RepID=UPI003B5BEE93